MANPLDALRTFPIPPKAPAWTEQVDQPGLPNIPYLDDASTVNNDDPNLNARMQLSGIDPRTTPSVLQGLKSAGGMDDAGKLYLLQDKLRDEVAGNLGKGYQQAALLPGDHAQYGFSTGATPSALHDLDRDIAENPVNQYKGQKLDYAQRQYEAGLGGFKSPQEAAAFGQSLEAHKATSPVDVARTQAQGNIEVQKAKDAGYEGFFDKLMGMNAAGVPPGLTMRGPGGIGLTSAPVSPGAASNAEKSIEQLTRELHALENPSMLGPIPMENPFADKQRLITAKRAELAAAQARATGRPMAPAPVTQSSGMNHVEVGTRDTIRGVPVVWDGQGWARAE